MDASVRAALAKWPNVPDCYDWLALDLRGHWRLGRERQSITNPTMNAFIGRNYAHDDEGRWLFQNGPQRVFVALDYTPWVWQIVPEGTGLALSNHVGRIVQAPEAVWIDEHGRFLIEAEGMLGVLHDHDAQTWVDMLVSPDGSALSDEQLAAALSVEGSGKVAAAIRWNEHQLVRLEPIKSQAVAERFGFIAKPTLESKATDSSEK